MNKEWTALYKQLTEKLFLELKKMEKLFTLNNYQKTHNTIGGVPIYDYEYVVL